MFPFFLFSMGAAVPLALQKKIKDNTPVWQLLWQVIQRYGLLILFAIFTLHARAWVQAKPATAKEHLISIACFGLLCFMFIKLKSVWPKLLAFAAAIAFLVYKQVDVNRSDIIIVVLANMAFFGTIIWYLTRNHPLLRIGVLPFVAAIFIAGQTPGSWAEAVYNWSPLPWVYKFYYLKYLFIIIPGTFAGEWLQQPVAQPSATDRRNWLLIAAGTLLLILVNVVLLFNRQVVLNLGLSVAIGIVMLVLCNKTTVQVLPWKNYLQAGIYLLWLGLFFDCTEGGIRKDPSNYSYYFVTGGLSFLVILGFCVLEFYGYGARIIGYLAKNGRNPMVAYVAGNLLLLPLLHLTGAIKLFSAMEKDVWLGVLRGLLFTGIVSLITIFFVNRKWFWKT